MALNHSLDLSRSCQWNQWVCYWWAFRWWSRWDRSLDQAESEEPLCQIQSLLSKWMPWKKSWRSSTSHNQCQLPLPGQHWSCFWPSVLVILVGGWRSCLMETLSTIALLSGSLHVTLVLLTPSSPRPSYSWRLSHQDTQWCRSWSCPSEGKIGKKPEKPTSSSRRPCLLEDFLSPTGLQVCHKVLLTKLAFRWGGSLVFPHSKRLNCSTIPWRLGMSYPTLDVWCKIAFRYSLIILLMHTPSILLLHLCWVCGACLSNSRNYYCPLLYKST